ncbi:MAG TPA: hypothetical protein PLE99_10295 [Candidatus Thiothrix moscowensis]|uniref:hypothetical protein n=1 Tax=Thiothrix sp. UBA2016 TaxID=1947695 RepID=UPI00260009B0|nr:hypothetical protein [Thiothrix sp. UBA2016]HRJ53150.1 hypothetical protein [Candidatus Thiothrix moscowensis]HRJ93141.1 hypothetical protein [Candidatus Thiothrix moscowensis]
MKNNNKIRLFASIASMVFLFCQLVGGTASAEYRGYWVDAVHQYQADNSRTDQPQAVQQDYSYQEPAYQPAYEPLSSHEQYPSTFNAPASGQAEYQQGIRVLGQSA